VDQAFWAASFGTSSTYNIQGYKKINVYGIDVVGTVGTNTTSATGGISVDDWAIDVLIEGQQPLVGGNITAIPNFYLIAIDQPANKNFPISKYSPSLKFATPYESVQFIQILGSHVYGSGFQTAGSVNIFMNLNFVVYYNFEGE